MIEIDGKQYKLVEISARKYQAVMDRMEREFGPEWQGKGGLTNGVLMLSVCLEADDKSNPPEAALWDLPMRILNALSAEATKLNGIGADSQVELEKN
jgi:hypothetical protein